MMGHRDKLKSGLEYDVIFARKIYCYLQNNPKMVKFAKNQINRRDRYSIKGKLNDRN